VGEAKLVPGVTDAELLMEAALDDLGVEPLPEWYLTTDEYMERTGCSEPTAVRHFHALMDKYGWRGRKTVVEGRLRWIVWREEDER
jgi:hypothetical protein